MFATCPPGWRLSGYQCLVTPPNFFKFISSTQHTFICMSMSTGEVDCGDIWLGTETSLKDRGDLEDQKIESKHCPTQKSISDSELMKSSKSDYQEIEMGKSKHKYWNSSDPELMISSGHNHLEGETVRSKLQQRSYDPEPMKTREHNDHESQTGKSQSNCWLQQNSSNPELMFRSEHNYQQAEATSARKHKFLFARSSSDPNLMVNSKQNYQEKQAQSATNVLMKGCSLPELLSQKKNTRTGCSILRCGLFSFKFVKHCTSISKFLLAAQQL